MVLVELEVLAREGALDHPGSEEITCRRGQVGHGMFGISAVAVSSSRNFSRELIPGTLPLGDRSVKW